MAKKAKRKAAKKTRKTKKKAKRKPKILTPDQAVWRHPDGSFRKGNPGGPGRPFLRQARFLEVMNEVVTTDEWKKVVRQALKRAVAGDHYARDWLSKYLMGQPEPIPIDERRTVKDILTDGNFVKWIETEKPKIHEPAERR